ncbi:MAG: hypothetical protein R3B09_30645 [Nannocystaceae bacterium]
MSLENTRRLPPRWTLPPRLVEHIDRSLRSARQRLQPPLLADLEVRAHLVRAGQAAPEELLARLQVLLSDARG